MSHNTLMQQCCTEICRFHVWISYLNLLWSANSVTFWIHLINSSNNLTISKFLHFNHTYLWQKIYIFFAQLSQHPLSFIKSSLNMFPLSSIIAGSWMTQCDTFRWLLEKYSWRRMMLVTISFYQGGAFKQQDKKF